MKPSFFNDNLNRNYPFLTGLTGQSGTGTLQDLPFTAIVDFGCELGIGSQYQEDLHHVYLYRVARQNGHFHFEFRSDAPGCYGWSLIFCRTISDSDYALQFAEAVLSPASLLTVSDSFHSSHLVSQQSTQLTPHAHCVPAPVMSGFLATGRLADLMALLADGQTLSGGSQLNVEPGLLRSQVGGALQSLNIANSDRTRITAPVGCKPPCWEGPTGVTFVQSECLTGGIYFEEGFNCVLQQNNADNSLSISGLVGAGAGQICGEIPLHASDAPEIGGTLLTGGPSCYNVLKTINGVSGQVFQLSAGPGTVITPVPAQSKITVDVDLHNLNVCIVYSSHHSSVLTPTSQHGSPDPCACGPL